MEVIDETSRQREHQSGHLALALAEVVDRVLLGHAVVGGSDDVEVEGCTVDGLPALPKHPLHALNPDAVDISVPEYLKMVSM